MNHCLDNKNNSFCGRDLVLSFSITFYHQKVNYRERVNLFEQQVKGNKLNFIHKRNLLLLSHFVPVLLLLGGVLFIKMSRLLQDSYTWCIYFSMGQCNWGTRN